MIGLSLDELLMSLRSLRSNVRKASKISFSLYPLYSYLCFEQCKRNQSDINPNIFKRQNFKKWRSIAILEHFAKAIVRQNGYKMVDFGNEVLINELDD